MHREFLVTSQVTQIEMECGSFIHKSCSSIRQGEVPQSSTDANGIILKINFAIAEDSALAPNRGRMKRFLARSTVEMGIVHRFL
jgi:hypothetical protein